MTAVSSRPHSATPPMGWNSWDCYGTTVTESEVVANAEFMAEHLLPHGWDTVVVDIQWYEPTARAGGYNDDAPLLLDGFGRPLPVENRFPSAVGGAGFGPLAARVHALGLRFGLHLMRGVPRRAVAARLPVLGTDVTAAEVADLDDRCDWNSDNVGLDHDHSGAQAYYDSVLALFAGWEVDFVKVDDMLGPYHEREIASFAHAVRGCGRDMVLSLSPGRALSTVHAGHLAAHADMWRVSDDLWDRWSDVYDQFDRMARWAPFSAPGAWPDADMLPLGRIGIRAERGVERDSRLTWDEQRTLMTLWCVSRSPLMFGGDLPASDPRTVALLTNDDVLEVLRASVGNRCVLRERDLVVWTAESDLHRGSYVAVFNAGEESCAGVLPWGSIEVDSSSVARDLWSGEAHATVVAGLPYDLPPHAALLVHLDVVATDAPGGAA